jgi:cell shape-determining protein MreD
MRRAVEPLLVIALAVTLYSVLGKISPGLLLACNVFSWAVLYFSLLKHEFYGAVMGSICGLLQDSLSLGVFGVAGLTKTLLGFGAGYISRKINVAPAPRNFVFLLILATLELALWKFLVFSLFGEKLTVGGGLTLLQPFVTALAVAALFRVAGKAGGEGP